jgi:hypothetical protein
MTADHSEIQLLTDSELSLILKALDSHEYWQLSDPAWRQDGTVVLPTDDPARWAERAVPSRAERAAIEEIQRCRSLAARLSKSVQPSAALE